VHLHHHVLLGLVLHPGRESVPATMNLVSRFR
jgi:hypothetical protein